jgi:SPP1 family predicted phage head-tail adaptor
MDVGKLNDRITIQQVAETRDAYGGVIETWTTVATVWARVQYRPGKEYFKADQVNAEAAALFYIRYRTGIKRKMRISFDGGEWDIQDIRPMKDLNKAHLLEIVATARVE